MRFALIAPTLVVLASWSEIYSEEHSRVYYFDAESGESAWALPPSASLTPPSPPAAAVEEEGWRECTADAASIFGGGGLQRAWRKIALEKHPDKAGGSSDAFRSSTETRDFLKSPLRYFAYRALHDDAGRRPVTAFGDAAPDGGLVRSARAVVGSDGDGWPRVARAVIERGQKWRARATLRVGAAARRAAPPPLPSAPWTRAARPPPLREPRPVLRLL